MKKFFYVSATTAKLNMAKKGCPHCGSSSYVGGRFGGRCYDCGYRWGNA